jgi:type I restriction enzyme S subunit
VTQTTTLLDALSSAKVFVDGDWVESKDQDAEGDVRLIQLADVGDGYYVNKSNSFLLLHDDSATGMASPGSY